MGALGDSLVGRKCGREVELQMQMRAQQAFDRLVTSGWETGEAELADLDFWLRADGNRRNPGATADLIAASLLVALLSGQLQWLVP
jgi:triphosphoribosyl-dephospho-CoA synthase